MVFGNWRLKMDNLEKINVLNGCDLHNIKRTLDLIMFEFIANNESKIYINAQCFVRIKRSNRVIVSTDDLYRSINDNGEEVFDWTEPDSSLFDDCLQKHSKLFKGLKVIDISFSDNDLVLNLQDDMKIEILIDTTFIEEKYRLFTDHKTILIVNS